MSLQKVNNLPVSRKLPAKLLPWVFSLYMSAIMAALMSLIITAVNQGFSNEYLISALHAYQVAMPSAFVCLLIVRPLVGKLVAATVSSEY